MQIPIKYLVVIPARGGSKGLPRKNILEIGGRPLIAWTIQQALKTKGSLTVLVSTDDLEIAKISKQYGALVPFLRPTEFATDSSTTESVMLHAINWFAEHGESFDAVMLLQPTSPVRTASSIENAIRQFESEGADSLVSVTKDHGFFWRKGSNAVALYDFKNRPRRQDISEEMQFYRENGSIYITRLEILCHEKNRLGGKISLYEMRQDESIDIDTEVDMKIAEIFLNNSRNKSHD